VNGATRGGRSRSRPCRTIPISGSRAAAEPSVVTVPAPSRWTPMESTDLAAILAAS
jgi:hypothetical protein